ncbi:hypothetical protein [Nocardiopsis ansamitocini]|uniref:Uncharacterized protein n=1 Tax=Nocardiopsis ansamitocini TaxID=1670832 RepID=A0A9W6P889_9ACTN|nr:hypothetical protein [Nocardiopsis ansamitocini]GLU48823.1 hypothetical protein Nans01_31740 [Nocardiopsis ansamitocini]
MSAFARSNSVAFSMTPGMLPSLLLGEALPGRGAPSAARSGGSGPHRMDGAAAGGCRTGHGPQGRLTPQPPDTGSLNRTATFRGAGENQVTEE